MQINAPQNFHPKGLTMECPHCAGKDVVIDARYPEVRKGKVALSATCENCVSTWSPVYAFYCVCDLEIGKNCSCDACKFSRGS